MSHSVRIFWRTARFEIVAGVAISLAFSVAALVLAGRMGDIVASACGAPAPCPSGAFMTPEWIELDVHYAGPLMFAASGLPFALGLLFGPALIAGELERGRLHLVWSLTGSRLRWLLWRVIPPALLVVILAAGPAAAAAALERVHAAALDPGQSFHDFGSYGPLFVFHTLAVFALGVAVGAVFGRVVPAVIVTAGLSLLLLGALTVVRVSWLPREIVPRDVVDEMTSEEALPIGEGFQLPDGRLLTYAESAPLRPPFAQEVDSPRYTEWLPTSGWQRVFIGIRGDEVNAVGLREAGATLVGGIGALGLCALLIRRRRPLPGSGFDPTALRPAAAKAAAVSPGISPAWRRSPVWLSMRMTTKVGRAELLGASAAGLGVAVLSLAMLLALHQARVEGDCVSTDCSDEPGSPYVGAVNFETALAYPLLAIAPFVVGGLLGAPLIAREFESGSGRLTWALSASRTRWLIWRLGPVLALTVLLMIPVAYLSQLEWHESILADPWATLPYFWLRGPTLIARAVAMFGLAVLAGVLTRRVLPALIVSAVAAIVLYNVLDYAAGLPLWSPAVAIPITMPALAYGSIPAGPGVAQIATDGSVHLEPDLRRQNGFPPAGDDDAFASWLQANGFEDANLVVPGSSYFEVVGKESAALALLFVASIGSASWLLLRRRPG